MVVVWRPTRPRFTLQGSLDLDPLLVVIVLTELGEERRSQATDVAAPSEPVAACVYLPFATGDEVLMLLTRAQGEVRRREVTCRCLDTTMT